MRLAALLDESVERNAVGFAEVIDPDLSEVVVLGRGDAEIDAAGA